MALHFNLKGLFLFNIGVMLWWFLWPYPLLGAICAIALYLGIRYRKVSLADGVLAISFLMNLWYVLSSMGNVRQYDYYNFVMFSDYFVRNNFFIAQPIMFFSEVFFQPPLWGLICALVSKLGMGLGLVQDMAFDGVRFISLFCVSGAGIVFWRLMKSFNFDDNLKLGLFVLFCFFPANSILANLVNNDALVYFLTLVAISLSFNWYKDSSLKNALKLGGVLLASGLTKFSGLMVVPSIGILGVCLLFQAKNKFSSQLWGEFAIIGVGAILGFSWGIFLLAFNLPLVPPPMKVEFQDLSHVALIDRFLDFSTISYPYADIWHGVIEKNVFGTLLKTALFGEWGWAMDFSGYVLYVLGCVLACVLVLSFFGLYKYKLGDDYAFNLFVVVLVFAVLVSWAGFWLNFPFFCSTEFRYIAILFPVSLLWLGNYLMQKKLPKWGYYTLAALEGVFVLVKFMLYLNTI